MKLKGFGVVALIALGCAVAQSFGRFTYGILLPAVRNDLGISNTIAGSLLTINVAAYLIGAIVVAAATGRLKLLAVMRIGFLFSTSGLVLAAVAPGALVLGVAMFLCGLGGACIWIPSPVIASDALSPERRGLAIGLVFSGGGLGIVFAGQLSGFMRSVSGDSGWRTVYLIQAAIALAIALLTFFFIAHNQKSAPSKGGFGGFSALTRMRGWLPITMAYSFFGFMYILVLGFLSTRLEDDSNWTSGRASLAFTLVGIAMIFGGPLIMKLVAKFGPRNCLATAFAAWGLCCLLVLPGWFSPTLVLCVGFGLIFGGIPTIVTLYFVQNASLADYGPSYAAGTLAFGVAQMISPQIGGVVADLTGSFALVLVFSAVFAFGGSIAALSLPKQPKVSLIKPLVPPLVFDVSRR